MYELSELFYYLSNVKDQAEMAGYQVFPECCVLAGDGDYEFSATVDIKGLDKMDISISKGNYFVNKVATDFKTIINDLKRIDSWLQMKEEANG